MINSKGNEVCWLTTPSIASRRYRPWLYVGITTLTTGFDTRQLESENSKWQCGMGFIPGDRKSFSGMKHSDVLVPEFVVLRATKIILPGANCPKHT
jgi:hypothetical protein